MRGSGANYNALYADDSDDDSDGFGCVFPKDGAGFDTDSDGSDFSNLADDLFEKASVDSFEYEPPSRNERASGSGYNRAKLDIDDDAVSVGSDREFQRASKSNKRWDWVEADEQSVGSDDDFEVQFEGRSNSVYDLKAGQGDMEDFLGGGGGEDLNEDFEFRTDFDTAQRTEAFFNEGTGGGVYAAGRGKGGELVETEYIPAKPGAARRRLVDPKFIASSAKKAADPDALIPAPKTSGKSKSAALIAAGLAQAAAKKGGKTRFNTKVETGKYEAGEATQGELLPATARGRSGEVVGGTTAEAIDEAMNAEEDAAKAAEDAGRRESDAQAKARIERSRVRLQQVFSRATSEADREGVEEKLLSEIEDIGDDVRKGLRSLEKGRGKTDISRIRALQTALTALDVRVQRGLTPAGMIQVAEKYMKLEHAYRKLVPLPAVAEEEPFYLQAGNTAPKPVEKKAEAPPKPSRTRIEPQIIGSAGAVTLTKIGVKKMEISASDTGDKIDASLGSERIDALIAKVKADGAEKGLKKDILKRLARAKKDALKGEVPTEANPIAPKPRGEIVAGGLTRAQRNQRAK